MRIATTISFLMCGISLFLQPALAQKTAQGSVVKYTGSPEEFIVLRDGVIYPLFEGADLYLDDVLRSKEQDAATIIFNGCEYELQAGEDLELDNDFCVAVLPVNTAPIMAAEAATASSTTTIVGAVNAPLVVGGVVLAAGGLSGTIGNITGASTSSADTPTSSNTNPSSP